LDPTKFLPKGAAVNDKDTFAVWLAETVLTANGDAIGAATLSALALQAQGEANLDAMLEQASTNTRRPGDFGVEFVGPLLPVLLVEFGRMLWDAYAKSLVEQGAKSLATVTIDKVKGLVRQTFSHQSDSLSIADAESQLRKAGQAAGLNEAQVNKLLETLHNPEAVRALAKQ
jgi:hypothetical protein